MAEKSLALFEGSAVDFAVMAPASKLTEHLIAEYERRIGPTSESEVRSWRNSLTALAAVVKNPKFASAGVGVEVKLPMSSKRIDVTFVGRDAEGTPSAVLVELKQWESAAPSLYPDNVLIAHQYERLHPSVQVSAYADYLRESHSAFTEHGFSLSACAYLHNMPTTSGHAIQGVEFAGPLAEAPMFLKEDQARLAEFLSNSLSGGGGMDLLPVLTQGKYSPSKKLIDGIAESLKDSPAWTLIDEQRLAFNVVRGLVERAASGGEKATVIITGGPGTGKSVIAAHLVLELSKNGRYKAKHTTASKAFTTNLRAVGGKGSDAIFAWNKDFAHKLVDENELDIIVVDEAHRVRETSNMRWTPRTKRSEIPQANELIRAARVSVFLLDERQNIRLDEIGTVAAIEEAAEEEGVKVERLSLDTQFRCNGCVAYINWVNELFSATPEPTGGWLENGEYDLRIMDSPTALENELKALADEGFTSRMVAGFCWPWSDPLGDGSLVPDVQIGDWERPWNEKSREQWKGDRQGSQPVPHRHPYYLWATEPERIGEIGCIYSAQGFEFDYCGVIMGNDLVWREAAGWVATKEGSSDPGLIRRRFDPGQLEALIQHVYRVLMTRGIRGTFVYSTDFETRRKLHSLVSPQNPALVAARV